VSNVQLTPAQHAVLAYAVGSTSGKIEWFPDNLKGGARKKVLEGLAKRGLAKQVRKQWRVSDAGWTAMDRTRTPEPEQQAAPAPADPELEAAVTAAEATWQQPAQSTPPRTRENSKQAEVIRMLKRPEGATIRQICEATGWQAHTVRGTFAGAFKKKLGLAVTSEKPEGGERIYRIA
jgi:hypothetical protein